MTILDPIINLLDGLNRRLKGENDRDDEDPDQEYVEDFSNHKFAEIAELNSDLPEKKLTLFLPPQFDKKLLPIKADRYRKWWEEDTKTKNHARFCLPLTMAAGVGWYILSPATFKVSWDGDPEHDTELEIIDAASHAVIDNHSAHGSFTIQACFVPRTKNPGDFVYIKGIANQYRLKFYLLEALIEAWWNPASFGLVCMMNQPGTVTIQKGEPMAQMFVVNAEQTFYGLHVEPGYPPRWSEWDEKRSSPFYTGQGLDYLRGVWPDETPVCPHFKNWSPSAQSGTTRTQSPEEAFMLSRSEGRLVNQSEAGENSASHSDTPKQPVKAPKLFPSQEKQNAEATDVDMTYRRLQEEGDIKEDLDLNAAEHLHRVAYLAVKEQKFTEAHAILDRCLQVRKRVLGDKDDRVAQCYNDLGYVHRMLGDLDQSEQFYLKALELRRKSGSDPTRLAVTCAEYGGLLDYTGKRDKALPILEEALALRRKHLGDQHADTLFSYNALGCVYAHLGRYEEAEEIFYEVIEQRTNLFGENNLDVANSHIDLAFLYRDLNELEPCIQEYLKGIEIQQRVLGEDALETASTFEHIAFVYKEHGDFENALAYFETVLKIKLKWLDEKDTLVAKTYRDLAFTCQDGGMGDLAKKYFAEADKVR